MNLQQNLTSFSELPILLIHGKKDSFIDYHNSVLMYYEKSEILSENTQLLIFDKSDHSMCISDNQEEYITTTLNFAKNHKK